MIFKTSLIKKPIIAKFHFKERGGQEVESLTSQEVESLTSDQEVWG